MGFLAEESGRSGSDEFVWIIDPLDGTTNFVHGFPTFAVSIALEHRGRLEQAVVYDPMRQELFTASRGIGAVLDGRRIRVSNLRGLEGALIGTGFPYRENARWLDKLCRDDEDRDVDDGRHSPTGFGSARPCIRGGGPARRLLGDRPRIPGTRRRARC